MNAVQAEKHLTRALALDPAFYSAHYLLAVVRKNMGDMPCAAAHYDRFLAVAPRDARKRPNALYGLAGCEMTAGAGAGSDGLGRLRPMLEQAAASERELEPFWGPCDAPEKALLGALLALPAPAPGPPPGGRRGAEAPRRHCGRGDGRQ